MPVVNGKPTMHSQAPGSTVSGGTVPAAVQQQVSSSGLAQPGQSPADAAKQLLGTLNGQGFQAPATASRDFATQLSAALRQFQQAQGLPQTGRLDAGTADALKNLGLAGAPASPEKPGEKAAKDNFERGGASLLKQGEKSRADVAKNSTPDTNFLDALLNKLGGDKGVTSDKQGFVGGTAETATNAQKAEGAGEVKKAGGEDKGSVDSKKARDDVQQPLDKNAREAKQLHVARGLKADQTRTDEQRRTQSLFGKDPTEKGILDEEADEEDLEGDGGDGKKRGRGGDQHGGGHDADASDSAGGVGARDGAEKSTGNAHSGDNNHGDASRGHAVLDDGSGAGPGHYRVPSLSEQAFSALEQIRRDQTASNRATTYSWDVTFYKPGIYSPGQKAQDLVHLVVKEATAFDPVWQRAQTNLQAMVRRVEKDAPVPTLDDIVAALRQARARDGDVGAAQVTFRRPPGRA
jgi:hypothetical protein